LKVKKSMSNSFYKNIKGKRILITGNTGFVGSYLSLTLVLFGAKVLGYSLKMKNQNFLSNNIYYKKKIKTIKDDILNINKHKKKIKKFKPQIIIHLASQPLVKESYLNTLKTYKTNIFGTVKLLELCKKLKSVNHILVFTSDKVYENLNGFTLKEKSKLGGIDPYSASKSSQDIIANSYKESFFKKKTNFSIVRAGNIIGGGDWNLSRLIPDIYSSLYNQKKIVIRNPNAVRPWQHILDVVNAIIYIISNNKKKISLNSNIFNVGPQKSSNITVKKLVKKIKIKSNKINFNVKINKIKFKETKILKLSNKLIKKKLGWKPILNINQSIILTNSWYEKFFENKKNIFKITEQQILNFFKIL
jgi:CDP-glucose 4,6-dehydratase